MSLVAALESLLGGLWWHFWPVALIGARLFPVALLSPLLGGPATPMTVRLTLGLALALFVHVEGGVTVAPLDSFALGAAMAQQLCFGVAVGLLSALPFDAARMAGRLIDTFRGAQGDEALLGESGKDSPAAAMLQGLLTATLFATGAERWGLGAILRSFKTVPLGAAADWLSLSDVVASSVGTAFATALSIGAPAAACALSVDLGLALAARVSPQWRLTELGGPLKLTLGAVALLVALGGASSHLLAEAAAAPQRVTAP
jgi:flagellar biosynthesis protein FliR